MRSAVYTADSASIRLGLPPDATVRQNSSASPRAMASSAARSASEVRDASASLTGSSSPNLGPTWLKSTLTTTPTSGRPRSAARSADTTRSRSSTSRGDPSAVHASKLEHRTGVIVNGRPRSAACRNTTWNSSECSVRCATSCAVSAPARACSSRTKSRSTPTVPSGVSNGFSVRMTGTGGAECATPSTRNDVARDARSAAYAQP